jgi:hypothetical protein
VSIASYADLVQRCQDWLFGRSDIAARVPDFITMFEAKANRTLMCRQMEARAIATVNTSLIEPQYLALPTDFHSMRRVRMLPPATVTGGGAPTRLKFATGQQMDDLRLRTGTSMPVGAPIWFTIFGNELELCPTPDVNYQIEMVYRTYIPALNTTPSGGSLITTNWLLALAPDAYLYGTLLEAEPYLHNDDRIQVWASGAAAAMDALNKLSDEALYNAGPLVIRRKSSGYS